jgi:predicted TIM-barrel fold metal-dependent hydrolase
MMAVIMNTRDETVTGLTPVPNDHVASAIKKHPDVFLAFGAIDPWTGKLAIDEVKRCHDLGLRGMGELNPARQHFYPNDPRFYPIWEQCAKLNMSILFHGGMAAAGAGTPGGMGIKLKYSQPIYVDEVAADFPELKIISAHPTWPWTAESLAVARHKGNYYIDLSGWAPKYFPAELLHNINTLLQDKAMFGSDWPAIGVERWLEEFGQVNMKPEIRKKIMLDNAVKFFGLTL